MTPDDFQEGMFHVRIRHHAAAPAPRRRLLRSAAHGWWRWHPAEQQPRAGHPRPALLLALGIPAVVFAAQVNGKWASGDHAGAVEAAAKAKKFGMIALVLGIIVTVIYVILLMMGAVASNTSSSM